MLTVAIPTYNRKTQLYRTLTALERQTKNDFKIFIVDNNSDYDFMDMMAKKFNNEFQNRITYIRRKVNIGGDNNIIGLFELVSDEWIWMISDDDYIYEDAIEKIYGLIDKFGDSSVIQFSVFDNYQDDMIFDDLSSYIETMFKRWNKKSASKIPGDLYACYNKLYKLKDIMECLYVPFKYNYSHMTTGLIVLSALQNRKKVVFTNAKILDVAPFEWSVIGVALGNRIVDDIDFGISLELKKKLLCLISFPYRMLIHCWLQKENHYEPNQYIEKLYYGYYRYHLPIWDKINYWVNMKINSIDYIYIFNLQIRFFERTLRKKYRNKE